MGFFISIKRSKTKNGYTSKIILRCDRGGSYDANRISSTHSGTRKTNCPFELVAKFYKSNDHWTLTVVNPTHNHDAVKHMEGHPQAMRLSESQKNMVSDLTQLNIKPKQILSTIKKHDPENASTLKTIYNAR